MKISVLPSNKSIYIDNIKEIGDICLIDYPDVFVDFYYTFDVIYENRGPISLYYKSKTSAEIDKEFIKNNIIYDKSQS